MTLLEKIHHLVTKHGCQVRLKVIHESAAEPWRKGVGEPVPGYIEINGPWPSSEVEWIEINAVETIHIGRLVKDKQVDHHVELEAGLKAEGIAYQTVNGIIRIAITPARTGADSPSSDEGGPAL